MKEVNLESILFKELEILREKNPKENYYSEKQVKESPEFEHFINAMREACKQTLQLASKKVEINVLEFPLETTPTQSCIKVIQDGYNEREYHIYIETQSILDIINQIK